MRDTLTILATFGLLSCSGGGGGSGPSPTVAAPAADQALTAGAAFAFDCGSAFVDPTGEGLTIDIALDGDTTGWSTNAGTLSGTPAVPGVLRVTATATAANGSRATDEFALVVFGPGAGTPTLPTNLLSYAIAENPLPAHWTNPDAPRTGVTAADNTPQTNPITNAGATLGRVLFYDVRLSRNDTVSCASCHEQARGFSDGNVKSIGFAGGQTARHSTGLSNARFYDNGRFFWDERAATLEDQVLMPIQDATEMGMTLDDLVVKLQVTGFYADLFSAAFGSADITTERISRALAQFVRSMVSKNSTYDAAFAGPTPNFGATFNAQQNLGRSLFEGRARCDRCHVSTVHILDRPHNIGLDAAVTDQGAGGGAFKVPSLRNVAVRAPFMHDGRFTTLRQVIDHYDSGVQASPNLSQELRNNGGQPIRLNLTNNEKDALEAFLDTLTDPTFLGDVRFSDPF